MDDRTAAPGLLTAMFARGRVADAVTDAAWLRALVVVESAVARAGGDPRLADAILATEVPLHDLETGVAQTGSPLVSMVAHLRERAGEGAHRGVTSQDVVDTATMIVLREALGFILDDGRVAADAAARLARTHRDAPVVGRTILQHAGPTTFGLRAARWMAGIDDATRWLETLMERDLAVNMGGPYGHADPTLSAAVAAELGLADPVLPWHATRLRTVRFASALGGLAGTLGKIAHDVALLSQPEVAEVAEGDPSRGGSSSIAGKHNATAAMMVTSCARRVPGLVATMFAAMDQELERGAGGWQAEWVTLTELLRLTGSAAAWSRDLLCHLVVAPDRMAAAAGPNPDLGAAGALVDRALADHARRAGAP